jgi:hypothetical protein
MYKSNMYIDLKAGTVNFKKKMTTISIFDRVKEAVSEPWLLDGESIQNTFADFYDEIDDLTEREDTDIKQLEWLKITYIIPMLTDLTVLADYKQKAYEHNEREFYENKKEEEAEKDFACQNGMDSVYWCDACHVGICEDPQH